jgi:hypothetical protein
MAPDPTFAFVGGPCCLLLDFVFDFWIIITLDTLLTLLFRIGYPVFYVPNEIIVSSRSTVKTKIILNDMLL